MDLEAVNKANKDQAEKEGERKPVFTQRRQGEYAPCEGTSIYCESITDYWFRGEALCQSCAKGVVER